MDIIFKSQDINIPERFREHAVGKLVEDREAGSEGDPDRRGGQLGA